MVSTALMLLVMAKPSQGPIDVIDPVPLPTLDRVLVFHMDEAILAEAALDGVERLTDPTHDFRNFIKGALALAMLVAFVVGMYQGSVMRMMFAIGAIGALWELGVKTRVPVRIDFYSPVMWYDYTTNYGFARTYHVPFVLAKIMAFSSGVNGYIAEAMDRSATVLMGSDYLVKTYASSVADAIKTATAMQYTDPKIRKAVVKFADHCVSPAISKLDPNELDQVGGQFRFVTALMRNGGPLSDGKLVVVDDVFSNQDPPPVVSCQTFLASIKGYMESSEGELTARMGQGTHAKVELLKRYLATKLNSQYVTLASFVGLGFLGGLVVKGMTGAYVRHAPVQSTDLNYSSTLTGGSLSSNSVLGNVASAYEGFLGDMASQIMAILSRITYSVVQRGLPLITGVMWYLIIMGFPIALMAAAFMGWRTMLTYTLSVMWVGSWLPATVMVKQIMNAYMEFVGNRAVDLADATYVMLQGFVSLDLLKSLYTSSDIAMIIAVLLIVSIPAVTGVVYFVALRGVSDRLVTSFVAASGAASNTVFHVATSMVKSGVSAISGGAGAAGGTMVSGSGGAGGAAGGSAGAGGGPPFTTGGGSSSGSGLGVPVRSKPEMRVEPAYGRDIPAVIVSDEPIAGILPSTDSSPRGSKESQGEGPQVPPDNTKRDA